MQERN